MMKCEKIIFIVIIVTAPFGLSSQFPFWNKPESFSQQQQKRWLQQEQSWNRQNNSHFIEQKMREEHQKWERQIKKKQKTPFELFK